MLHITSGGSNVVTFRVLDQSGIRCERLISSRPYAHTDHKVVLCEIAGPSYGTMAAHQPLAASKLNRKVFAAVAVAALVAAAVGVVLSTRATGRQELVSSYRYVDAHFIFVCIMY